MKSDDKKYHSTTGNEPLSVQTSIKAGVMDCWKKWTNPADVLLFNNPFNDWHTVKAEIDIRTGGRCYYRMEKKDGKEGFDFAGTYSLVVPGERIECMGDDGRKTINTFSADGEQTIIKEIFEPDAQTPLELQLQFCQHILDNFKQYMEQQ